MFLDTLHQVNQEVAQQLKTAGLNRQHIQPHTERLPRMEFVKSDHSTISIEVPAHRFNLQLTDNCKTVSDCANRIVQFVLDAANEFSKPLVHLSSAYLNYSPTLGLNPVRALSFDIAIWEYDGEEARWLELNHEVAANEMVKTYDIGFLNTVPPMIQSQSHQLMKTEPFEINLWTPNIVQGVQEAARGPGSASQYLIRLEQALLASARSAADVLSKMQKAAITYDKMTALFQCREYEQVRTLLSEALETEVTLHVGDTVAIFSGYSLIEVNETYYRVDQTFSLLAGLKTDPMILDFDPSEFEEIPDNESK